MSNRLTIEPTEFTNIRSGEKTYGVRVYDDYDQCYDNTWDEIPVSDMDILRKVLRISDYKIGCMLDFVKENNNGIYIGGEWYVWNDVKDILNEGVDLD